jgi:hypothetical protein
MKQKNVRKAFSLDPQKPTNPIGKENEEEFDSKR